MNNSDFTQVDFSQLKEKLENASTRVFKQLYKHNPIRIASLALSPVMLMVFALITRNGLFWIGFVGALIGVLFTFMRRVNLYRHQVCQDFADTNELTYIAKLSQPTSKEQGILYGIGHSQKFTDIFEGELDGSPARFSKYQYTVGSGKNKQTKYYHVLNIKLKEELPYLLLDNVGNNLGFMTNLPAWPSEEERISLEGDFDKHFKLYSTVADTSDPLSIITPDVMQTLIEVKGNFDVEVNGGYLNIFSSEIKPMPDNMASMVEVAHKITRSFRSNVKHYTAPLSMETTKLRNNAGQLKRFQIPVIVTILAFVALVGIEILPALFDDDSGGAFIAIVRIIPSLIFPLVVIGIFFAFLKKRS